MIELSKLKQLFRILAVLVIFFIIFFDLPLLSAHVENEDPQFKYSKEANELHHKEKEKADVQHLWLTAMGSTLLISIAPYLILFVIPLDATESKQPIMKVLLAFASGGLLGDAFLHLIPHAVIANEQANEHSHSHSHSHSHGESESHEAHDLTVGLWVLCGIITFLGVEKLVRILKGENHSHSHSHSEPVVEKIDSKNEKKKDGKEMTDKKTDEQIVINENIKISGYLNLVADFFHNFTDGLALGASFLAGQNIGIVTTITILIHEIPHEIGDFAILIKSGCSRTKAMSLQLVTALGALTGTAVSLLTATSPVNASKIEKMSSAWILPFTAGGFIYIALVTVIPELLEESKPSKFLQSIIEICALLFGVYMMVLIAQFE